jgi:hypothetical protein
VDLDEILHGDDDIEGNFDAIYFNSVASIIPNQRTLKLLKWMQ